MSVSCNTVPSADHLALHSRNAAFAMRATYAMAALMGISLVVYQYAPSPEAMLWLFLLIFATGVLLAVIARRREWHRKYIDYRALAEGLRVQAFWRRAGILSTGDQHFVHDNFLQKQDMDLGWIRNVMRHANLEVTCPVEPESERVSLVVARRCDAIGLVRAQAVPDRSSATRPLGTHAWDGDRISLLRLLLAPPSVARRLGLRWAPVDHRRLRSPIPTQGGEGTGSSTASCTI